MTGQIDLIDVRNVSLKQVPKANHGVTELFFVDRPLRFAYKGYGLEGRLKHYPRQLAGGEQHRVSMGRGLVNDPELILADEPTGNLDPETTEGILDLLFEISQSGRPVIMATHDYTHMKKLNARVVRSSDGQLLELTAAAAG